jgi:hypothetical protein
MLRVHVTTVLTVAIALLAGACSGDDEAGEKRTDPPGADLVGQAPLEARPGVVVGKLPAVRRRAIARQVGEVVDGWFEAAYLGGDYPRSDFADAFPGFTSGAARLARRDRSLLSNASIGKRIEEVTATNRTVRVDVLAPNGRVAGATARFRLGFTTTGGFARRVVVHGRLVLTHTRTGWRVFAYDVRRSNRAPGSTR